MGFFNFMENSLGSSKIPLWANGSRHISQNPRFYGRKRVVESENGEIMDDISAKVSLAGRKEAQGALLEYLHSTRSLQFMDAENMSQNSPRFLDKLLKKFEAEEDIGESITRFLRYHPINEFEPFFESVGLIPSEYSSFLGSRVKQLKAEEDDSLTKRTKFLLDLGFVENSNEMRNAPKDFRDKAGELQERFDFLVDAGLDRQDVLEMLKVAPQILNMTKVVLEMKIDFLVNGLGYPVSTLVVFPAYISYTIPRVNLRFSMYNWLIDQGTVDPNLALSTIIACSDVIFIRQYVNHHSRGPEIWEKLKKEIYSD